MIVGIEPYELLLDRSARLRLKGEKSYFLKCCKMRLLRLQLKRMTLFIGTRSIKRLATTGSIQPN